MPIPLLAVGLGLSAAGAIGNIVTGLGAGKKAREAGRQQREYERQLKNLEANRQAIIDPYSGVKDLSSMITNPFANLQVATGAAEMQARETDISLASTLDAIRASGGGGATALAQAASRAKQGVAASIEQQEAENARLRAQGEQQMQQMQMQEAIRMQEADIAGKQFTFGIREEREMQKLDRAQAMSDRYANQQARLQEAKSAAFGSAFSSIAGLGASLAGG